VGKPSENLARSRHRESNFKFDKSGNQPVLSLLPENVSRQNIPEADGGFFLECPVFLVDVATRGTGRFDFGFGVLEMGL
jgi:hypothetical protein